ncbi:MAG: exodeoxyribonuclease VII large subunit [Deltaproteobacteria bacterium]|nr:exodeoxyribonuclease VII large subunit [Deltaproteobacteria bacterium]
MNGRPQPPSALSVSELSARVRNALYERVGRVVVFGELSNFKAYGQGGNWYFTLKDAGAQVKAVMFSRDRRFLKYRPKDGDEILVRGRVDLYAPRGDVQVIVDRMEPLGAGRLQEQFERLKAMLNAEGLFSAQRKKPVPRVPRRVGIVTSPQAAALQDILRTLRLRDPTLAVTLSPSRVQGEGAAREIAAALDLLNRLGDVEVILLARGGGSLEDLWSFNEEVVARAIARSRIPVICGVGHETDVTIADFVADLRAPTPTGAAERAVPQRRDLEAALGDLRGRLLGATGRTLQRRSQRVEELRKRLLSPQRRLELSAQRLDEARSRLGRATLTGLERRRERLENARRRLEARTPDRDVQRARERVAQLKERLGRAVVIDLGSRRVALDARRRQLGLVGPLQSLERGYALAVGDSGTLLRRASQVREGDAVTIRLHEGALDCTVVDVRDDDALDLLGRRR